MSLANPPSLSPLSSTLPSTSLRGGESSSFFRPSSAPAMRAAGLLARGCGCYPPSFLHRRCGGCGYFPLLFDRAGLFSSTSVVVVGRRCCGGCAASAAGGGRTQAKAFLSCKKENEIKAKKEGCL